MTEKEFDQQVWRRFDTVTIDTGMETTIMNVCFSTRSVRIYLKSAPPEWVPFERIVNHKSYNGSDANDATIIEELHNKIMKAGDKITRLEHEKEQLAEKISKNYLKDLLTAVNMMKEGLTEKKNKLEKVENGLRLIAEVAEKVNTSEN